MKLFEILLVVLTLASGLILLAVWLSAWLAHRSRVIHLVNVPEYLKRAPRAFVIVCCAGALFLPPMIGNFGLGVKAGGPIGVMPYSNGLALQCSESGTVSRCTLNSTFGVPRTASRLTAPAPWSVTVQWKPGRCARR